MPLNDTVSADVAIAHSELAAGTSVASSLEAMTHPALACRSKLGNG